MRLRSRKHEISVTPLGSSAIMAAHRHRPEPPGGAGAGRVPGHGRRQRAESSSASRTTPSSLSSTRRTRSSLARRNQLLSSSVRQTPRTRPTSVPVQSLLSQLGAVEQELANNEAESQQVLATLTTETGASVVSVPTAATGASRHVAVYGALAALLGLVLGLLIATLREVIRPTVAQPGAVRRELGAVLFGSADARGGQIVAARPGPARAPQPGRPPGRSSHGGARPGPGRAAGSRRWPPGCATNCLRRNEADARGAWARSTARIDTSMPAATRARTATCCAGRSPAASTARSAWPPTGRPACDGAAGRPHVAANGRRPGRHPARRRRPPTPRWWSPCPSSRRTARLTRRQTSASPRTGPSSASSASGVRAGWPPDRPAHRPARRVVRRSAPDAAVRASPDARPGGSEEPPDTVPGCAGTGRHSPGSGTMTDQGSLAVAGTAA